MKNHNLHDLRAFQWKLPTGKSICAMLWTLAHDHHSELVTALNEDGVLRTGVVMLSDSPNMTNSRAYRWGILEARDGAHPIKLYHDRDGADDVETLDLCGDIIRHYVHHIILERAGPAAQ
jgi:hypothetical protein